MTDILTLCLTHPTNDVKAFLVGQGRTWMATYPVTGDVVTVSTYGHPNANLIGGMNKACAKAAVHASL